MSALNTVLWIVGLTVIGSVVGVLVVLWTASSVEKEAPKTPEKAARLSAERKAERKEWAKILGLIALGVACFFIPKDFLDLDERLKNATPVFVLMILGLLLWVSTGIGKAFDASVERDRQTQDDIQRVLDAVQRLEGRIDEIEISRLEAEYQRIVESTRSTTPTKDTKDTKEVFPRER